MRSARSTIRWWYHFDDPKATPDALVAGFEKAESRHQDPGREHSLGRGRRLRHAALHRADRRQRAGRGDGEVPEHAAPAGDGRAAAARPLHRRLGRHAPTSPTTSGRLHRAPDGKRYYVPLQYVVLYLYVRQDWFAQKKLPMPTTFDAFLRRREGAHRRRTAGASACAAAPAAMISGPPSCSAAAPSCRRAACVTPAGAGRQPLVHRPLPHRQGRAPLGAHRRVPADRQQHEGGPHRHDDPPYRLGQRPGRGARRRHHRDPRARAARRATAGPPTATASSAVFSACPDPDAAWKWVSYLSSRADQRRSSPSSPASCR